MSFVWDEKKNTKLRKDRGIDFEAIVDLIEQGDFKVFVNPSSNHDGQMIFIVKGEPYPYVVPFRNEDNGDVFLITIFQSRKFKKIFSEE